MYPVLSYFTAHKSEKQEHFQEQSLFFVAIWSTCVKNLSVKSIDPTISRNVTAAALSDMSRRSYDNVAEPVLILIWQERQDDKICTPPDEKQNRK